MPRRHIGLRTKIAALVVVLYGLYRQDLRKTMQKLRVGSQVVDTTRGPLEYATQGNGPAILAIHGSGGGYEQGLLLTRLLDPAKFTIVGLSRPGFRQTPLSTGQTPEQQADAAAELLDRLQIQKAAILGISAGGLTAMQMAIRHPERCKALILVSSLQPPTPNERVSPAILVQLRSFIRIPDFLAWIVSAPFGKLPILIDSSRLGKPKLVTIPESVAIGQEMRFSFWPIREGRDGILNDVEQVLALSSYPLEEIKAPTLIIHGTHDRAVPVGLAEHASRTIPGAQIMFIPGGFHLVFATHFRQVGQRIQQFLDELQ